MQNLYCVTESDARAQETKQNYYTPGKKKIFLQSKKFIGSWRDKFLLRAYIKFVYLSPNLCDVNRLRIA